MKRILSLFLSLCLLFGVTGCQLDSETLEIISDVAEIASDIANEIGSTQSEEQPTEESPTQQEVENETDSELSVEASDGTEVVEKGKVETPKPDEPIRSDNDDGTTKEDTSDEQSEKESLDELYEILPEDGSYTKVEDVSLYIHLYKKLPENFMTKQEARDLGWQGGGLDDYAEGMCIGGDRFGNYEGLLPSKKGRTYTECDIDTLGKSSRGAKRIVFSNDGLIFYSPDHYESFIQLYDANGEVDS